MQGVPVPFVLLSVRCVLWHEDRLSMEIALVERWSCACSAVVALVSRWSYALSAVVSRLLPAGGCQPCASHAALISAEFFGSLGPCSLVCREMMWLCRIRAEEASAIATPRM